jgi:hypothetical protein
MWQIKLAVIMYYCEHVPTKYVLAHPGLSALRKRLQMTGTAKMKFETFQLLLNSHCAWVRQDKGIKQYCKTAQ